MLGDNDSKRLPDIDAAYHAEYDRYGPRIVGPVTGSGAYGLTVRLAPQPDREK